MPHGGKAPENIDKKDFTLNEADGDKVFSLSKAKGSAVVLHFLLKTTCPHCIFHTRTYFSRRKELAKVIQVFIKPDDETEIVKWSVKINKKIAKEGSAEYPTIYRDPKAQLAKAFDIPYGYKFHRQVVHYPALVILDPEGKEVFRYVGKNNRDRYPFEDFLKKINGP